MCGRYNLVQVEEVDDRFQVEVGKSIELKPNHNVAPSQTMPVIRANENGKRQLELMKWGIPRVLGKDVVKELINTRADKAFGGFWRKTVVNRRCLVPASGFYEWRGSKGSKTPFYIHPKDEDLFAFAGIWSTWINEDGQEIKTYSIMTTEPNKEMSAIHSREPVMLHREDEASWLNSSNDSQDALERLLYPYEDGGLEIYEVSRDVNAVRNNNESLYLPLNSK